MRISTIVPRSGRARRTLFRLERDIVEREEALHAVRDVPAGERGAADILDVLVEIELGTRLLADELLAPGGVAHLVAVALAVFHDLDAAHRAIRAKGDRIGDVFVLADHLVDDEELAARGAPHALLGAPHGDA